MIKVFRRTDGLTGIAVADNEYPERVAHSLITKFLAEFEKACKGNWKSAQKDEDFAFGKLEDFLKEYADPEKADKYLSVQKNLDEVKEIMHKNIEEVLLYIQNTSFIRIYIYVYTIYIYIHMDMCLLFQYVVQSQFATSTFLGFETGRNIGPFGIEVRRYWRSFQNVSPKSKEK
ncbi:hypothetical protein RFI_22001 [Reticulomyxa filosa]|uniref:Longin domain-containing protein n=1 Tax=Reticulomyxa filosa TaxID=46433 RepID=X6MPM4_RETFI|nr:hypothetical protein RFI_22001 [Reticulomyxa filosa]|eukprot:ETO15362.1 hypothetical protein RFI_22001 [Reticulomyxa filosa]